MKDQKKLKFEHVRRPKIISQFGKIIIMFSALLVVAGYIFWQAWVLLGPPQFKVTSPINGATTSKPYVKFNGAAAGGTSISVNGSTVGLNPDGTFKANVPLKPGPNKLYIHAANRTGKTKSITLIVYYSLT